jgi:4-amino-4-deoxy-L-arabinose transferase-like glycosyltransferase
VVTDNNTERGRGVASQGSDSSVATWGGIARRHFVAGATVIFLIAALLRFPFLTQKGFWNMEFITLEMLPQSPSELFVERIRLNHMPLYFEMLKGWAALTGNSELALKLPSAIFSFLTVVYVFKLARRFLGRDAALTAGAFIALSQFSIWSALELRMYSMSTALTTAVMYYFLVLVEVGNVRAGIASGVAMFLNLFTQLIGAVVLPLEAVYCLLNRRVLRARWAHVSLVLAAPWIAMLPMVIFWATVQTKIGVAQETTDVRFSAWGRSVRRVFWGDYAELRTTVLRAVSIVLTAAIAVGVARSAARLRREGSAAGESDCPPADLQRRILILALMWGLAMPLAILATSLFSKNVGGDRYCAPSLPGMALLLHFGVQGWSRPRVRRGLLVLSGLLLFVYSLSYVVAPGEGVREAVAHLKTASLPGDALIQCDEGATRYAFVYYGATLARVEELDKHVKDDANVLEVARKATGGKPGRVWVFLYRDMDSPLYRIFVGRPGLFKLVQPLRSFRKVRLACFEVQSAPNEK